MQLLENLLVRLAFNSRVRQKAYRKLAMQIAHGIPFYRSVLFLYERAQESSPYEAKAYERLLRNNAHGGSLYQALRSLVSNEELLLLGRGEQENLGTALSMAHDFLAQKNTIAKVCVQSMAYPFFLLLLLCGLVLCFANVLVPQFEAILPPEAWRGEAALLRDLSLFLNSKDALPFAFLLLAFPFFLFFLLPRLTGKIRLFLERFAPFSLYRDIVGANFLSSLSMQMALGIQPREIFHWILTNISSRYLLERVERLDAEMGRGKNLGQAFLDCGMNFPSREVIDDLALYSELPNFEKELLVIAREALEHCLEKIRTRMKILQFFLLLLVLFSILFVLRSLALLQTILGEGMY